ncbi:hypothetical protein KEM56_006184 [Ascosphaera pollenicola]|nr:hypothetical protein KEM56_006184 [Ascosphaera pollenicola]
MTSHTDDSCLEQPLIIGKHTPHVDEERWFRLIYDGRCRTIHIKRNTLLRIRNPRRWLPTWLAEIGDLGQVWNLARLVHFDRLTGRREWMLQAIPAIGAIEPWHHKFIELRELVQKKVLQGYTFEARYHPAPLISGVQYGNHTCSFQCPRAEKVVAHIAFGEGNFQEVSHETLVYRDLARARTNIARRFLGHIQEYNRVIGYILENVGETCHPSTREDFHQCEATLRRFHDLGFHHGNVNKYAFLMRKNADDLKVWLTNFEASGFATVEKTNDDLSAFRRMEREELGGLSSDDESSSESGSDSDVTVTEAREFDGLDLTNPEHTSSAIHASSPDQQFDQVSEASSQTSI